MWVYLPRYDLIADPTAGKIYDSKSYYEAELGVSDPRTAFRENVWLNDWQLSIFEYAWFR